MYTNSTLSICKVIFVLGVTIAISCTTYQHNDRNSSYNEIDNIFKQYDKPHSPGYALGIIQNGKLAYSKGYGQANLEHSIPLSDSSAVYIGSMAKQFTAAALLILESQGKVDLSKPVHHYLPEFPLYSKPITISHLIHHTSGIRETNSLQLFQGIDTQFEEVFNTDDLYKLILAQKELNFQPGAEYRYSSGGYAVLAMLIERISKQSFRNFLKKSIFDPLGMSNTSVSDNHNEVIANRADSYWPSGNNHFEQRHLIFDAYGDGGIITTLRDLVEWDKAFYDDVLGVDQFADKMYQKGVLNNGNTIEYARALQVREYKGLQMITHNGGMLGFRVDMVRFPESQTTFILLGNSAFLDPTGDILKVADIWLQEKFPEYQEPISNQKKSIQPKTVPSDILKSHEGYYWTDQVNYFRRITARNDSLFFDSGDINYAYYLSPVTHNEFILSAFAPSAKLIFNQSRVGNELSITFGATERTFRKFSPEPPAHIRELETYAGTYFSKELDVSYTFFEDNDAFFLQIDRNTPMQVFPIQNNNRVVWNGKEMLWIGFGEIKFNFDNARNVSGFTIGDNRVSGVQFKKE